MVSHCHWTRHTHSAYLRQRRSNPNSIFYKCEKCYWCYGTSENWGLEDVTVRRTARKRTFWPCYYGFPTTVDCRTASCDCNTPVWWGTRDRRDFYFRSGYFRFRPGCTFQFFRMNFRPYDLRTLLNGLVPFLVGLGCNPGPTWKSADCRGLGNPWNPHLSAVLIRRTRTW